MHSFWLLVHRTSSSTSIASHYLQGISVKVTEKYRPPRRIALPPGLGHLEPPADLFNDDVNTLNLLSEIFKKLMIL